MGARRSTQYDGLHHQDVIKMLLWTADQLSPSRGLACPATQPGCLRCVESSGRLNHTPSKVCKQVHSTRKRDAEKCVEQEGGRYGFMVRLFVLWVWSLAFKDKEDLVLRHCDAACVYAMQCEL